MWNKLLLGLASGLALLGSVAWAPATAGAAGAASVGPLLHITQTLNNCGPASVAEVLHYWGIEKSQAALNVILRHGNPVGMSTDDVADYVASLGLREFIGGNGSREDVKALVANGFPVIVAQYISGAVRLPHFRPIEAYDDAGQYFVSSDPMLGDRYRISYRDFDQLWKSSNGVFLVIYPPDTQQRLLDALSLSQFTGPSWMTPAA